VTELATQNFNPATCVVNVQFVTLILLSWLQLNLTSTPLLSLLPSYNAHNQK